MRCGHQGFSLLEMIIVIVIIGILGSMTTKIMVLPVQGYLDLQRRNALVDNAESALRQMQRDIRRALPNSIRITDGGKVLELLHTTDGGRYRSQLGAWANEDVLNFAASDNRFDVIGTLHENPDGWVVIYNLGEVGADAYAGDNRAAIAISSTTARIELGVAKQFPRKSPQQRFFIVDTPITYRCNLATGVLLRYTDYPISAVQSATPDSQGRLQAQDVTGCNFSYSSVVGERTGLVTLEIMLTDSKGESTGLMHQVHVDNAS